MFLTDRPSFAADVSCFGLGEGEGAYCRATPCIENGSFEGNFSILVLSSQMYFVCLRNLCK